MFIPSRSAKEEYLNRTLGRIASYLNRDATLSLSAITIRERESSIEAHDVEMTARTHIS